MPAAPRILARLGDLVNDINSSMDDIVELLKRDAALTARITCPTIDGAVWKPPVGINGPERLPLTFEAVGR